MTTLADHLPTASLLLRSPDASSVVSVPPTVNVAAAETDFSHALLDEHGDELLRMARLITGRDEAARPIVSEVLQAATASANPPQVDVDTRTPLVSATLRACQAVLDAEPTAAEFGSDSIDWPAGISAQQRSAVALYVHGGQTPAEIGSLLNVPLRAVCLLLLSALDELATADPPRRRLRASGCRPRAEPSAP